MDREDVLKIELSEARKDLRSLDVRYRFQILFGSQEKARELLAEIADKRREVRRLERAYESERARNEPEPQDDIGVQEVFVAEEW
jgi:hypothetical protein